MEPENVFNVQRTPYSQHLHGRLTPKQITGTPALLLSSFGIRGGWASLVSTVFPPYTSPLYQRVQLRASSDSRARTRGHGNVLDERMEQQLLYKHEVPANRESYSR
jgi:hypothetical protein